MTTLLKHQLRDSALRGWRTILQDGVVFLLDKIHGPGNQAVKVGLSPHQLPILVLGEYQNSLVQEKPGKLEVGGASRDSTGLGALEEGLISS